jgi:hypothetical protein
MTDTPSTPMNPAAANSERNPPESFESLEPGEYPDAKNVQDPLVIRYDRIAIPSATPYAELDYAQRRAIILRRIEKAGHPQALGRTYSEMGEEFDVSKQTISDDMQVLSAWVATHLERDHVSILDAVFRGSVQNLVEDGEYAEARETAKEWYEWLADMGIVDRVPDRLDLDATVHTDPDKGADYEIISDEATVIPPDEVDGDGDGGSGDA